jgi:hypothetical protein
MLQQLQGRQTSRCATRLGSNNFYAESRSSSDTKIRHIATFNDLSALRWQQVCLFEADAARLQQQEQQFADAAGQAQVRAMFVCLVD